MTRRVFPQSVLILKLLMWVRRRTTKNCFAIPPQVARRFSFFGNPVRGLFFDFIGAPSL